MKYALIVVMAMLLYLAGCCIVHPHKVKEPSPLGAWVFKSCAHNGDHEVCDCGTPTEVVDAKTGKTVHVCY